MAFCAIIGKGKAFSCSSPAHLVNIAPNDRFQSEAAIESVDPCPA